MNGISLVAVQSVLGGPAAGKLSPRLADVGQEIQDCAVARRLMATPSSDLGAFLRLVRDAAAGVQTADAPKTPAVELRKELESLDDASLEDLVAILISIRDALADALPEKAQAPGYRNGALGWGVARAADTNGGLAVEANGDGGDLRGDLTEIPDGPPENGPESPDGAPRMRPDAPPVYYTTFRNGASAGDLLALARRLRGQGGTGGFSITPPGMDTGLDPAVPLGPMAAAGFTTDDANQRAVAQTDSVLKAMAGAVGRHGDAASTSRPDAGRSGVPDLIYMPVVANSAAADSMRRGDVERIELVSLPGVGESDPVQALQDVVRRVEQAVLERQKQGVDSEHVLEPEMEAFVSGRLPSSPRSSSGISFSQASATQHTEVVADAVRQAQAAMADMAERQMAGDVRLDSDRLRAVMHLEPPVLGRVHINLQVDNGSRVHVTVGADQQGTQDFLKDHQEDLRQGLADQGFQREDIDIRFEEDQAQRFQGWLGASRV